ncbi:4-hydroxythreonine-4-phosphate dehydrogenase PdxA [Calditrichota bacterium LG25]
MKKKHVGITLGDPAGIGPEIVLKALLNHPEVYELCTPVVFGPLPVLKKYLTLFGMEASLISINDFKKAPEKLFQNDILVFNTPLVEPIPEPGQISAAGGENSFKAINAAIEQALEKNICAIATAPINKQSLKKTQIPFLDHTAIFTNLTDSHHTMTLFVTGNLRIFFYSRHIPFKEIVNALDEERLLETIKVCHQYLKQMGFENPHLAVAALNPHAGEDGLFGTEEIDIITPAIERARMANIRVTGPIPADSVFHLASRGRYEAVLSLYHDQGHIAAKTLDFFGTISLTLGLPFLRTSVDHGTAFEIAGKGIANETSMVEAIKAAARYAWEKD